MPRQRHGDAMPTHLRSTAIRFAVETVGNLREVLQYSAPLYAAHGWARMCMYRTADAMDTIGLLVGAIAAQLAQDGVEHDAIRRMLKADREQLRTARPVRTVEWRFAERDLRVMPAWIVDEARDSVAFVLLRLSVMLRSGVRPRNALWVGRCLRPMVEERYDFRNRFSSAERVFAEAAATALQDRLASAFPDGTDRGRPLLDVLRAAFHRTPGGRR
ncbi:hypothetical protein ACFC58_39850 [Kitasatospora purpeofusca]|uniref:hypothetical protein n=1 Tax=Kitasatospora purpeofusca TaxID=67352 RepID=UPI0035D9973A